MMAFRFNGQLETNTMEFTCNCGTFNQVKIEKSSVDKPFKFKCRNCEKEITIWQQRTHWHLNC